MHDSLLFDFCPSSSRLEQAVLRVIAGLDVFTADDIHVLESEIAACHRRRQVIGSLLVSLEKQGYIAKYGNPVKSKRRECHYRPIQQWVNLHIKGASK